MKYEDEYIAQKVMELKLRKTQLIVYTIVIIILLGLTSGLAIRGFKDNRDKLTLIQEKQDLEQIVEMQSSMIDDLHGNCRDLQKEMER